MDYEKDDREMPNPKMCDKCHGTGKLGRILGAVFSSYNCPVCDGTGWKQEP